uniref:Reverse transcriptase domain-containing protein n=1 Tax=Oryzias latipes TaxID=8090 RepID=A0A3B3HT49_ORYLA
MRPKMKSQLNKHFGFGKLALATTFVHPHHYYRRIKTHSEIKLNPQQSLALVIAVYLLLSGDIHQCPGPAASSSETPFSTPPSNNRSTSGNFQVHSLRTFYKVNQRTHPNLLIPRMSAVTTPATSTTSDVGWMKPTHPRNNRETPWPASSCQPTNSSTSKISATATPDSAGIRRSVRPPQYPYKLDTLNNIWTYPSNPFCRSPAAAKLHCRLRHQNTPTTWTNNNPHHWRNQKRGVDYRMLRSLPRVKAMPNLKIELFNVQSLSNKTSLISEHITDRQIDMMCLTETWHKPEQYLSLNEACPPDYTYLEKARVTGRGGGLAVIYRRNLHLTPISTPVLSTFECLLFKCRTEKITITVILIYRPPKINPGFFNELQDLLTTICATSPSTLILGDFNLHVDTPTNCSAVEFLELLDTLQLTQHVKEPTHSKGHTLDLAITDTAPITNMEVYDLGVSDHKVISLELALAHQHKNTKREIYFRNLKNIDHAAIQEDIQKLSLPSPLTSVNESVDRYNSTLHNILQSHAPLKSRTVSFTRSAPWYTEELRILKRLGRTMERRLIKNNLTVHKQAYRDHQKLYCRALKIARQKFYSHKINSNTGNSKQLFSTIHSLLKPPTLTHSDASVSSCDRFKDFFTNKISSIKSNFLPTTTIPTSSENTTVPTAPRPLSEFTPTTQKEVEAILRTMKSSTCSLDPLPTALIKDNISIISPIIATIINQSLQAGHVPLALKTAIIRPHLKKPALDPDNLANYRPISNLPFLSKVLEKVVAAQLHHHLSTHSLYEKFQSGFRPAHSTETALVRVMNDLLMAADQGSPSLLILLDLSAAFDTVDHGILLNRLHTTVGLSGNILNWFKSYLTNRTEYVALGNAKSHTHTVTCGVPQGSVLGPSLFTIYISPLGQIIRKHNISIHCYADDTQLYVKMNSTPTITSSALQACLEEIEAWMAENSLQFNSNKTEAILIGTPHQIKTSSTKSILVSGHNIPLSSPVINLGVKIDSTLTFDHHIRHLSKVSFFHLKNIAKLRPSLTQSDAEKLIHAFVSSRLDYCNALLVGIPGRSLEKLQHIQNCAARVLTRRRKFDHITPVLQSLHWLPIRSRIQYKLCLLTYQCVHGTAPAYLSELLSLHATSRLLRSNFTHCLHQPRTRLTTMGDRAFQAAAPRLWNNLPQSLRAPQSLGTFKKGLKTFLFNNAF